MEEQDMEQRVWERVKGNGANRTDLRGMEMRCLESAAAFRQMGMAASGEARDRLMRLHRQAHGNAMALRGMRVLNGEEPEPMQGYAGEADSMRRGLARAFRRSQKARLDYETMAREGEYAPVFRIMAEEEGRTMGEILEMMGKERK